MTYQEILEEERARVAREANDCHNPAGPGGGQFCSKGISVGTHVRFTMPGPYRGHTGVIDDVRDGKFGKRYSVKSHDRTKSIPWAGEEHLEVIDGPPKAAVQQPSRLTVTRPLAKVSIRATTHRDQPGFSITGKDAHGRSVRIFTKSRDSAERIKDKIRRGESTKPEDFD